MSNKKNNNNSNNTILFISGLLAGAAATYYLTTPSGRKFRKDVSETSKKVLQEISTKSKEIKNTVSETTMRVANDLAMKSNELKENITEKGQNLIDEVKETVHNISSESQKTPIIGETSSSDISTQLKNGIDKAKSILKSDRTKN